MDSKTLRLSHKERYIYFKIASKGLVAGLVTFGAGIFLNWYFDFEFIRTFGYWGLVGSIMLFLAIFTRNGYSNESPGASDNGTGVAVVLALAKYFQAHPVKDVKFYFPLFNCEEFGQIGSVYWLKAHQEVLPVDSTWLFNIDMIAHEKDKGITIFDREGILDRLICDEANKILLEACTALNIPVRTSSMVAGRTDRRIFTRNGYCAIDLGGVNGLDIGHSVHDTKEHINFPLLADHCKVLVKVVEILQQRTCSPTD